MNNEELKKKILAIVRGAMLEADELPFIETTDNIADALIAAGMGDVKEVEKVYRDAIFLAVKSQTMTSERSRYIELNKNIAEHRAKVAERALESACEDVKELVSFLIELSERVEGLYVENYLPEESEPKAYINRAEKELAEERE